MKVIFRVDASLLIGSGHVMRCLVLANSLSKKGYEISFACTPLSGDLRTLIHNRGFNVITLSKPQKKIKPVSDDHYTAWLQKSVSEDAQDFLKKITFADLVIVDHYAIGIEWERQVVKTLGCKLFAIDDLARCHYADLILDQSLGRDAKDYSSSNTRVLAGSDYAIVNLNFLQKREAALSKVQSEGPPKVLISMGGVDKHNVTLKVLKSLYYETDAEFSVLLPESAPNFIQVKDWCSLHENVVHLDFVSDMASLMLDHDIAIGAAGTTSWERACLGLPNIVVPIANNQQFICDELVRNQATIKVNIDEISSTLLEKFNKVIKNWTQFKEANLAICDGRGVRRVVLALEQLLWTKNKNIFLERASLEDIALVYEWQCHPDTRKYSTNNQIPTRDEHQSWMTEKLKVITDYYYMIVHNKYSKKVGAVRLDRLEANNYLISIFIDPKWYGKGIANQALRIVDDIHPDITIHATVFKDNVASQKLFKKACYRQVNEESYIRQPIEYTK